MRNNRIRKIIRSEVQKALNEGSPRGRRRRKSRRGRRGSLQEEFSAGYAQDVVSELLSHPDVSEAALISARGGSMSIGVELVNGDSMGFNVDSYGGVEFSESWDNSNLLGGFGGTPPTHGLREPRTDATPKEMADTLVGYTKKARQIRFM